MAPHTAYVAQALALLALLAALQPCQCRGGGALAVEPWRCSSDAACQLNGKCGPAGTCICDPGWMGTNCSALRLGGSRRAYMGRASDTTAWGMHPRVGTRAGVTASCATRGPAAAH